MYCTNCGGLCNEGDNVCIRCGNKLRLNRNESNYSAPIYYNYPKAYAGFWLRFGANIIDAIILEFSVGIISIIFALIAALLFAGDLGAYDIREEEYTVMGIMIYLLTIGVVICSKWLYYAFFESSKLQATPGKLAVGIKVTDSDGNRLSFARATGRFFAKIISGLTFGIGYIMAGFTEKKQALHDMIAGTLIMRK